MKILLKNENGLAVDMKITMDGNDCNIDSNINIQNITPVELCACACSMVLSVLNGIEDKATRKAMAHTISKTLITVIDEEDNDEPKEHNTCNPPQTN